MINTEFAPNETISDSILGFKILPQPWRWRKGKELYNLKRRLKTRFFPNSEYISLYFSGRGALHQYLSLLKLTPGDKVMIQGFTCEAVVLPILKLGLEPIYVDISKDDFSMSFEDLEKKYNDKIKVIILQHTFGITPKNREKIITFATKNKIHLIEDLAHGFDIELYRKAKIKGALLLSFGRSKLFSSVFGGAIILSNKKMIQSLKDAERQLPNSSLLTLATICFYKAMAPIIKATYDVYLGKILHFLLKYFNLIIPEVTKKEKNGEFDMKMLRIFPNLSAIFMLKQLDRFNDVYLNRIRTIKKYNKSLHIDKEKHENPLIRYPYFVQDRQKVITLAKNCGINLGTWYSQAVAPLGIDLVKLKYKNGSCPVAENLCRHVVNLPTDITKSQSTKIIDFIYKYRWK